MNTRSAFAPLLVACIAAWTLWGVFDALGWW